MLTGSTLYIVMGSLLGLVLVAIGMQFGRRSRPHARGGSASGDAEGENREALLTMLKQLGSWTSEYSGNVTQYQAEIGALRQSAAGNPAGPEVMDVLQQIMQTNDRLKNRLDAAEIQLEKQTLQIENYLTEARTDGLTGLFNRRAFDKKLEEMFRGYRAGGRSFVLVLIDIDHFKNINDTYGHQAGDVVLQQVASKIQLSIDNPMIVARFGGEEFTALMDGPLRIAARQLDDVRKQVSGMQIEVNGTKIQVTISVGLSEPRDDLVPAPVLRRADEALYMAKNIGRNRVYYHDGRSPALVGAPEIAR